MRLSVSMIVRDEESCLGACLATVAGADEIVVVDTGSTDRTKEIAAAHGAQLHDFEWCDDFAAARNFSMSKCTGDWVIILDADEEIADGGVECIRDAIERAARGTEAIAVWCESMRGEEGHWAVRVVRRGPGVFWRGAIHNYLTVTEDERCHRVRIRYGYSEAHKRDPDRALRILTKVVREDPTAGRERYYLAREFWYRKQYDRAIAWYRAYLQRATWGPEVADAWLMMARCHWMSNRGAEARVCCLRAIGVNPQFREALLLMAEMSGPTNAPRWREIADTATDENVLFVRGRR